MQQHTPPTRRDIQEICRRAYEMVEKWPEWEKGILENSLRPSWSKPREVVLFQAKSE